MNRLILENGYEPDVIYTSRLKRAIHSTWVLQRELGKVVSTVDVLYERVVLNTELFVIDP
jgi:bisphosphoglycerate-dependent phosphoglycerate mutase